MKSITDLINESTQINEAKFSKPADLTTMIRNAVGALGTEFDVTVSVNAKEISADNIVKYSIGHIIENTIAAGFEKVYGTAKVKHVQPKQKAEDGENNACDLAIITSDGPVNVEVKAYKTISNLKPTSKQWNADYILCVKYKVSGSHVTILELNCVEPNGNPDKHIKITREMINQGITSKITK